MRFFEDLQSFWDYHTTFFKRSESINGFLVGNCASILNGSDPVTPILMSGWNSGHKQAAAMWMPAQVLWLAGEQISAADLDPLLDHIATIDNCPPGVWALSSAADAFVERWRQRTSQDNQLLMTQKLHELIEVADLPQSPGQMRMAAEADTALVAEWGRAFLNESLPAMAVSDFSPLAKQHIDNGQVYLWENGETVSMTFAIRPAITGIFLGYVYTPPTMRGHGYATTLVTELSRHLLASDWQKLWLFTDIDNPTSNRIYRRIGYQPLQTFSLYRFKEASE